MKRTCIVTLAINIDTSLEDMPHHWDWLHGVELEPRHRVILMGSAEMPIDEVTKEEK